MKFMLKTDEKDQDPKLDVESPYEEAMSQQAQRSDYAKRLRTIEHFITGIKSTEASTGAMAAIKAWIKSTQGAGEIGDEYPLSLDNIQAFEDACGWYEKLSRDFGVDHSFVEELGDEIVMAYADHFQRSTKRIHTNYKFIAPPDVGRPNFFTGKKQDSLEK